MRRGSSTTCMALGLLGLARAWGCGTEPTALSISVTVLPHTVSVAGGSQSFSATVANDPGATGVTWSITGCAGGAAACGSLTNVTSTTATYTAPTTVLPGSLGVRATSVADNTKSFTAIVAIATIGARGQIAFVSARDGNYEIYVMNQDGSGQVDLTNNPGSDYWPAWSPDGTRIAFTSERDNREIYVMNADGSGVKRLTDNPASDEWPAWAP